MPDTNITYAEIQTAATQLTNGESQINEILMSLQTVIQNLISSGFTTDTASGVFESAYQEFTAGLQDLSLSCGPDMDPTGVAGAGPVGCPIRPLTRPPAGRLHPAAPRTSDGP